MRENEQVNEMKNTVGTYRNADCLTKKKHNKMSSIKNSSILQMSISENLFLLESVFFLGGFFLQNKICLFIKQDICIYVNIFKLVLYLNNI